MTKAQVMLNKKKQKNSGIKNGSVTKNKAQKLQNTPTGKLAVQNVKEGRSNGVSPKVGKSNPKKKKNENKNKSLPVKAKKIDKAKNDSDNEEDDESIEDSDSDDEVAENKGLKMFKGMKNDEEGESDEDMSDSEEEESSENDEEVSDESDDDEDDEEEEEDEDNGTPLKALLGESIADDDDDDDFVNNEESDEDDDISDDDDEEEETGNNDSKESINAQDDDNEEESDESEESDEDEEDEDENETPLKALLGDTIPEDDDDDDFVNNEESDEDDDISDDDDDDEEAGNNDSKDSIESKGKKEKEDESEEEESEDDEDENSKAVKKSKKSVKSKAAQSPNSEEDAGKKDRTIYIGNVPKDSKLKDIKKLFRQFGVIESMRVRGVVAEDSNMSLKVATITKKIHPKVKSVHVYVVFKDESSAKEALKLNNHKFNDHVLRVDMASNKDWSRDQSKSVFLGNLPFDITEDEVREQFVSCGTIESVRIIKDRRSGLSRGIGYINFESVDSVTLALEFNDTKLKNRQIRVKRSNPGPQSPKKKQGKKQRWRDRPNQPNKNHGKNEGSPASGNGLGGKKQKKPLEGQLKRGRSEENTDDSTSPVKVKKGKLETSFQGEKAESKKKVKASKMNKKNKVMAGKLKSEKNK